ncbi:MAG: UDP-2,3-diacylglucosamine diphosphatase [Rhodanobacter sp.]|jgi:UDP-2,3-diacylglucosamine hydrolase|nr:UDP-2,3-diacylglucosamine diphosphatase [Rhodanobacter sp.]
MTTLFISDLHLDASRPHITRLFVGFVRTQAIAAKALYILGDLFETWIGDDGADETADQVATALTELHAHGVPCFFIHGNRDFLLGDAYARQARMTLLPDPSVIDLEGERVLIMHGDTLCTDDAPYQAFRAQSRTPPWQRAFLSKSLPERQAFAEQARAESRRYTQSVADAMTDVNAEAVLATMRAYDVRRLIHGHTHRPAVHRIDLHGTTTERIVLGDWYAHSSVLRVTGNSIQLV